LIVQHNSLPLKCLINIKSIIHDSMHILLSMSLVKQLQS